MTEQQQPLSRAAPPPPPPAARADEARAPVFAPRADNRYHLKELLRYHDREFVRHAYLAVLRREPDEAGLDFHLHNLRHGRVNKADVLESLLHSPEAERYRVKISGLRPPFVRRLRHLPYLGYLIRWVRALFHLPNLLQAYELGPQASTEESASNGSSSIVALREEFSQDMASLRELVTDAAEAVSFVAETVAALSHLRDELPPLRETLSRAEVRLDEVEAALTRLTESMVGLQQDKELLFQEERSNAAFFQELLIQEQRVIVETQKAAHAALRRQFEELQREQQLLRGAFHQLERAAGRPRGETAGDPASAAPAHHDHRLDVLLAAFENRFRGEEKEIRARLQFYVPLIVGAGPPIGSAEAPVLDVGCGRGEWLEMLTERHLVARGVETNRLLVAECRARGREVTEADALAHLRALPDASLGAVTGFHLIEHLPFPALVELLDETWRVLRPGGLVIFETPNPKNLVVAACNFYSDPTHQRPVYPETIQFLLHERGFSDVRLEYLNAVEQNLFERAGEGSSSSSASPPLDTWFNWFYGYRDFAVIGTKPRGPV